MRISSFSQTAGDLATSTQAGLEGFAVCACPCVRVCVGVCTVNPCLRSANSLFVAAYLMDLIEDSSTDFDFLFASIMGLLDVMIK